MNALDRILALTTAVEQHVDRGAWAEAGALDAERRRLLAELCDSGPSASFRDVLQDLLARTQNTVRELETRKQETADTLGQLNMARGPVRDYERNSAHGNLVYLRSAREPKP
jgi:hypothetical protein